jgi:hypothetical protein
MVVLRATKKVLSKLSAEPGRVAASDTALGDWYVNRLVVDRQPLLLLVSACSLLSLLLPARDVRTLPGRLPTLVATRLQRLGIAAALIDAEVADARSTSRAVGSSSARRNVGWCSVMHESLQLMRKTLGLIQTGSG